MPTWVKVLLIAGIVIFVGVLGLAGAGWYWWRHNGAALMNAAQTAEREGEAAGSTMSQNACIDQSIERLIPASGLTATLAVQGYLHGCLRTATASPGFCDGVPTQGEIIKTMHWRTERCESRDAQAKRACEQIMGAVQQFCTERSR